MVEVDQNYHVVLKQLVETINETPLGVAEYELMPIQLKAEMPTVEELENELGRDLESMINSTEEKNKNAKNILKEVKGN